MFCNFKKGTIVLVHGSGKKNGKFYATVLATVIEKDPFFKDYHVKFNDGTEDWLDAKCLKKLFSSYRKGVNV